jgi:predicted O-linked N-acetylglucosamine transferase (SPINDLY family)
VFARFAPLLTIRLRSLVKPTSLAPGMLDPYNLILDCIHKNEYAHAADLCEELIAEGTESGLPYWYSGLAQLLQGHETEAQLTWVMAIANASPEQAEAWTSELVEVLQTEAERREKEEDWQTAWLIRQHIKEADPANVNNLLRIINLSLDLEQFDEGDLVELGIIELLKSELELELDVDLLIDTLNRLLETSIEHPLVMALTEVSTSRIQEPEAVKKFIAIMVGRMGYLATWLHNNRMACLYGEICRQLDPNHPEVLMRLAMYYQSEYQLDKGMAYAQQYYETCTNQIHKTLANAIILRGLMYTGARWQEALDVLNNQTVLLKQMLVEHQFTPDYIIDASLVCLSFFFYGYFDDNPATVRPLLNEVGVFYQKELYTHLENQKKDYRPFPAAPLRRPLDRKKIRIGYLGRFMMRHSVGWLSRWVFEHYDRDRFEVYAYFNQQARVQDFSRAWFASNATKACAFEGDILGISEAIQEDEIDILIDMDSLTADYSYGVTALKPAPIQVSWLGFDASGCPTVDYFLADPYVLPDNAQDYYSEKIWRLPNTYLAVDGFEVAVPNLRRDQLGIPNDAIVYLSAQAPYKRNPETLRLQMKVLKEVPNSYFLLKGLGDRLGLQSLFHQMAEEEGVSSDRIIFLERDRDEPTHRANLGIADVVLDTFPYNGATTTMETLWMGIPMVTLVGQQFSARNSYGMMMNAGITEGIAWTGDEYIEWGIRLGKDEALRQQISWRLKQSRQTSPLWNAKAFTRELETAYEQMWQRYLDQR